MINGEQALELLIEANPVPDLLRLDPSENDLATRLADLYPGSSDMTQIAPKTSNNSPGPSRNRPGIGIAAAAAVLVAGALLFNLTDDNPVANQPRPAIAVATAFVEAYAAFDLDLASSYLAADADLSRLDGGQEGWRLGNAWLAASGAEIVLGECAQGASVASVACPFDFHGLGSNEIGLGPYGRSVFDLTVENGQVTAAAIGWSYVGNGFSDEMWVPFANWIQTNYPEDMAAMYSDGINSQLLTEESIDLWKRHVGEYVAEVKARNPFEGTTVGHPGLPPEGDRPSLPAEGELVASLWEHVSASGGNGDRWLYLYSDGRLLSFRSGGGGTTGWLEQRLTAEGVDIIRSEIIATGLFEPNQPTPDQFLGALVQVRNGDRLIYQGLSTVELRRRLTNLWSWLPADAWEDSESRAYVASRFAVCIPDTSGWVPTNPDSKLSLLPEVARDLFASADHLPVDDMVAADPTLRNGGFGEGSSAFCLSFTTEEARNLVTTLDEAGVQRDPDWVDFLTFILPPPGDDALEEALTFWPLLPHGVPGWTPG